MTERKPPSMSFTSWVDHQIAEAEKRGVFDNLPGAGKPLNLKPQGDGDYGQAWIRDYARREGVPVEEFLPTPLKLRKETERLAEAVEQMRSEEEVRSVVADLNRRIAEWRRIPVGPQIFVRLVNSDEMVARWRRAQAAQPSQSAEGKAPQPRQSAEGKTPQPRQSAEGKTPQPRQSAEGKTSQPRQSAEGGTRPGKDGARQGARPSHPSQEPQPRRPRRWRRILTSWSMVR